MGFDQGVVSPCRTTKPGRFGLCLVHQSTHTEKFRTEIRVAQFHLSTDLSTRCLRTLNGAGTR